MKKEWCIAIPVGALLAGLMYWHWSAEEKGREARRMEAARRATMTRDEASSASNARYVVYTDRNISERLAAEAAMVKELVEKEGKAIDEAKREVAELRRAELQRLVDEAEARKRARAKAVEQLQKQRQQ